MTTRVPIRSLSSGVVGLDEVLGGGIPELSFNLIIGGPGCGKTTLGHQIAFANASQRSQGAVLHRHRRAADQDAALPAAVFVLRHRRRSATSIRFVNLARRRSRAGSGPCSSASSTRCSDLSPALVVVDSFRSVMRHVRVERADVGARGLRPAPRARAHQLRGDDVPRSANTPTRETENPVFTVADGIIWLYQSVERNSVVRKLQVVKMRGQGQIPGLQTMRIDNDGLSVFPRLLNPDILPTGAYEGRLDDRRRRPRRRCSAAAYRAGYSVLVAGPSGSGKTVLTNQFIAEGVQARRARHHRGLREAPERLHADDALSRRVRSAWWREGKLEILYLRPLDLSIDETLLAMRKAVERIGAKRAVIDSLSGLELALAPTFRDDFRESLYRMVDALTGLGVTVMSTVELSDSYVDLQFSPQSIAFLTDAIIMQRYVEIDGELRRAMGVVKVRGSQHSKEMREYTIAPDGRLAVGDALKGYVGLLSGTPRRMT